MKKHYLTTLLFFVFCGLYAQTPMFFNTNVASGANTFPFANSGTSRKVQWFIPPGSLGAVTPGNNITKVWFQAGSTASQTYPVFTIRLKTGSGTGLTGTAGGPIEPGMTLVYSATNQTLSTTASGWFGFTLQTPWLYNPLLPLIVEVEHNATTTSGPTVLQAVSIPGPGNGRQWSDYLVTTNTGVGTNQVNFGIDVLPATPCTVAPQAAGVTPANFTTCPFISNPQLSLTTTYSFGGIVYQWNMSTVSNVGPFNPIPGATLTTYNTPSLGVNTWYTCVATCTNPGGGSTTLTPSQFQLGASVVSTVPYFEDFEGILIDNRLPNCSWYAQNLGTTANSYVSANSNNRIPKSGTKFGSFSLPSSNNSVYSNGITLYPGITYSAAIWYSTEYFGYSNWSDLSLMIGNTQTSVGQQTIASVSPAISGPYKLLSGVFTVPSQGDYYICLKANGQVGSALYLNYDDLSVTIPCDGLGASNSPTLITSSPTGPICSGDILAFTASGADTYTWSNGDNNPNTTISASTSTAVTVMGTNTLTGCTAISTIQMSVNPSPTVYAFASNPQSCPGEIVFLSAVGANLYAWNNAVATAVNSVAPQSSTTYTVIGTAANGCSGTATVGIAVKTKPTVNATTDRQTICVGDAANLSATGATSYNWISSSSSALYQGANVTVPLNTTTNFTVNGTGSNGCVGTAIISQNVQECVGIETVSGIGQNLSVFPNPSKDMFTFKLAGGIITKLVITDLSGRTITELSPNTTEVNIDFSKFAAGVYYANVMDQTSTKVIRLVKE